MRWPLLAAGAVVSAADSCVADSECALNGKGEVACIQQQCALPSTLVMVGTTGTGKSNLANFLAGRPNAFLSTDSKQSVTINASSLITGWFGMPREEGGVVRIVDTPGLADTKGDKEGNAQWNGAIQYLMDEVQFAHRVLLVENSAQRFTIPQRKVLKSLRISFGSYFWDNLVVFLTRWRKPLSKLKEEAQWYRNKFMELDAEVQVEDSPGLCPGMDFSTVPPAGWTETCPQEANGKPGMVVPNVDRIQFFAADLVPAWVDDVGRKKVMGMFPTLRDVSFPQLVALDYEIHVTKGVKEFRPEDMGDLFNAGLNSTEMDWVKANQHHPGLSSLEILRRDTQAVKTPLKLNLHDLEDALDAFGLSPHMLGMAQDAMKFVAGTGALGSLLGDDAMSIVMTALADPQRAQGHVMALVAKQAVAELEQHLREPVAMLGMNLTAFLARIDYSKLQDPAKFGDHLVDSLVEELRETLVEEMKPSLEQVGVKDMDWLDGPFVRRVVQQGYAEPYQLVIEITNRTSGVIQLGLETTLNMTLESVGLEPMQLLKGDEVFQSMQTIIANGDGDIHSIQEGLQSIAVQLIQEQGVTIQEALKSKISGPLREVGLEVDNLLDGTELHDLAAGNVAELGDRMLGRAVAIIQVELEAKLRPTMRAMGIDSDVLLAGADVRQLITGNPVEFVDRVTTNVAVIVETKIGEAYGPTLQAMNVKIEDVISMQEMKSIVKSGWQDPATMPAKIVTKFARGVQRVSEGLMTPVLAVINMDARDIFAGDELTTIVNDAFSGQGSASDVIQRILDRVRGSLIKKGPLIQQKIGETMQPSLEQLGITMDDLLSGDELSRVVDAGSLSAVSDDVRRNAIGAVDLKLRATLSQPLQKLGTSYDAVFHGDNEGAVAQIVAGLAEGDIGKAMQVTQDCVMRIINAKLMGVFGGGGAAVLV